MEGVRSQCVGGYAEKGKPEVKSHLHRHSSSSSRWKQCSASLGQAIPIVLSSYRSLLADARPGWRHSQGV